MADGSSVVDFTEIGRLAKLDPLAYEQARSLAARKMGIRATILDDLVKKARPREEQEAKENPLQTALDLLVNALRRYASEKEIGFGYANGCWHIYGDGHWKVFSLREREDLDRVLAQLCPEVGLVFGKDSAMIEKHLRASDHFMLATDQLDREPFVAVRNGTVNVDTLAMVGHNADHLTTRYIDIDFDPGAACPEWEKMLGRLLEDWDQADRDQIARFIQEWMGVALAGGANERTPRALRKALFLYGPPNSGKSTVFDVVRQLIGSDRIAAATVAEIAGTFGLEELLTASAWITEEVDDVRKQLGTGRVKCIITGEPISAQQKFNKNAVLRFKGPVGWAGNTAPNFAESSNAVYDRIVVLPMERTFSPGEAKAQFGNLKPVEWLYRQGEFPGIFNWALAGYHRLLERGHFEDIKALRTAREQWREQNDVVYDFVRNYMEPADGVRNDVQTIAWSVLMFAKQTRKDRWPELHSIKMALKTAVAEVYPTVKRSRPVILGTKRTAYENLGLTAAGLAFFQQAERDHETIKGENLRPNEKMVLGG